MKNFKKIIFSLIALSILVFNSASAMADDKEYNVDSAEFDVYFAQEGGDAFVTEKWCVNYINGEFTRFYKDIYYPDNQLEYFPYLSVEDCKINGVTCEATDSIDRVDYHYYHEVGSTKHTDTIHWFYHVENDKVYYEITYRLKDIVKLNENNRAAFCYRFIGDNFPKSVNDVKITVHVPRMDDAISVSLSGGDYEIDGNNVIITGDSMADSMFKVNVTMDADGFNSLGRVIDVEVSENRNKNGNPSGIWGVISVLGSIVMIVVMPLIPFIAICYLIFWAAHRNLYIKGVLKKNPYAFNDASNRLEGLNIPFTWYLIFPKIHNIRGNNMMIFFLHIFDMCRRGRATIKADGIYIAAKEIGYDELSELDNEFIQIVNKHFKMLSFDNCYYMNFDSSKSNFIYGSVRNALNTDLKKWLKRYKKSIKNLSLYQNIENRNMLKQMKKDIKFWYKFARGRVASVGLYEIFSLLKRNQGKLTHHMILSMLNSYNLTHVDTSAYNNGYIDDDYFLILYCNCTDDYYYDTYIKSSSSSSSGSGCSSCSSCSSCGGCGGGGAD